MSGIAGMRADRITERQTEVLLAVQVIVIIKLIRGSNFDKATVTTVDNITCL